MTNETVWSVSTNRYWQVCNEDTHELCSQISHHYRSVGPLWVQIWRSNEGSFAWSHLSICQLVLGRAHGRQTAHRHTVQSFFSDSSEPLMIFKYSHRYSIIPIFINPWLPVFFNKFNKYQSRESMYHYKPTLSTHLYHTQYMTTNILYHTNSQLPLFINVFCHEIFPVISYLLFGWSPIVLSHFDYVTSLPSSYNKDLHDN